MFLTALRAVLNALDAWQYILNTITDLYLFWLANFFWHVSGCPNRYNSLQIALATTLESAINEITVYYEIFVKHLDLAILISVLNDSQHYTAYTSCYILNVGWHWSPLNHQKNSAKLALLYMLQIRTQFWWCNQKWEWAPTSFFKTQINASFSCKLHIQLCK